MDEYCQDACYQKPGRWKVARGKRKYAGRRKIVCRECGKFVGYELLVREPKRETKVSKD